MLGRKPRTSKLHLQMHWWEEEVVKGLDQISHAMGEAGVAATTIRNLLNEQRPIRR